MGEFRRCACASLVLVACLSGARTCLALARPEIRRAIDLVDREERKSIYRIHLEVVNCDSLPVSVIYVPFDQIEWLSIQPRQEKYRTSYLDIRGSTRAGTGVWRELVREEEWTAPSDRVWAADCELGGVERGAMLNLIFFVEVDEAVNMDNKPLRVGCGTCGSESSPRSGQYWSSVSEPLLKRVLNQGTLQVYRYLGSADTLVLSEIREAAIAGVSPGWSVAEQSEGRIVLLKEETAAPVEFTIKSNEIGATKGFMVWEGSAAGADRGVVPGPGSAEYSRLNQATLVREPGWSVLVQGVSVTLLLVVLAVALLRIQKRRK